MCGRRCRAATKAWPLPLLKQPRSALLDRSGRALTLVDCDNQYTCALADIRVHRLAAWWPKQGYYVVRVNGYENANADLIRATDGLITTVAAVPVLSPDTRFAIASDPSVNNGGGRTEILDMRTSPPKIIAPNNGCWQDIQLITVGSAFSWVDNTTIVFREAQTVGLEHLRRLTLRIIDNKAEWDCRS